jgi:diguanylate cyclase (GGDEF)-like protein
MNIVIIDDSLVSQLQIEKILKSEGYQNILKVSSAIEAYKLLNIDNLGTDFIDVDLIILDTIMPGIDGIEACRHIKGEEHYRDIPIIIVTGYANTNNIELAFNAGAIDYITKPFNKVEMLVRVRSAIKLKHEMDRRKARELELQKVAQKLKETNCQLEEANRILRQLSSVDGLTGISNRRKFDESLQIEWVRSIQNSNTISLIIFDIDYFKNYNDTYGHLAGDDCLKQLAKGVSSMFNGSANVFARYGGEEFVVLMPATDSNVAMDAAKKIHEKVMSLEIPHLNSPVSKFVSVSLGVASIAPNCRNSLEELIEKADNALYQAKQQGRNRIVVG